MSDPPEGLTVEVPDMDQLNESLMGLGVGTDDDTYDLEDPYLTDAVSNAARQARGTGQLLHDEPITPDESNLFVGDLARGLSEAELQQAFAVHGTVAAVSIKRDRATGKNLGYGFVKMSTHEEAVTAKDAMHETELHGRKVRVGWAQKNTSLFVGGLDDAITTEQLRQIFAEYGPIDEEHTFIKNGKYGFAKMKYRAHAELARKELNSKAVVNGHPLKVEWNNVGSAAAQQHHQRTAAAAVAGGNAAVSGGNGSGSPFARHAGSPPTAHSVHVQFEGEQDPRVTEGVVRSLFTRFCPTIDVVIPRNQPCSSPQTGSIGGYSVTANGVTAVPSAAAAAGSSQAVPPPPAPADASPSGGSSVGPSSVSIGPSSASSSTSSSVAADAANSVTNKTTAAAANGVSAPAGSAPQQQSAQQQQQQGPQSAATPTRRRFYAFVHFPANPEGVRAAAAAVEALNNTVYNGLRVACTFTRSPPRRPGSGPNSGGARRGGRIGFGSPAMPWAGQVPPGASPLMGRGLGGRGHWPMAASPPQVVPGQAVSPAAAAAAAAGVTGSPVQHYTPQQQAAQQQHYNARMMGYYDGQGYAFPGQYPGVNHPALYNYHYQYAAHAQMNAYQQQQQQQQQYYHQLYQQQQQQQVAAQGHEGSPIVLAGAHMPHGHSPLMQAQGRANEYHLQQPNAISPQSSLDMDHSNSGNGMSSNGISHLSPEMQQTHLPKDLNNANAASELRMKEGGSLGGENNSGLVAAHG